MADSPPLRSRSSDADRRSSFETFRTWPLGVGVENDEPRKVRRPTPDTHSAMAAEPAGLDSSIGHGETREHRRFFQDPQIPPPGDHREPESGSGPTSDDLRNGIDRARAVRPWGDCQPQCTGRAPSVDSHCPLLSSPESLRRPAFGIRGGRCMPLSCVSSKTSTSAPSRAER